MSWDQAQSVGERTRDALGAATSKARGIVADADRTGDELIREAVSSVARQREAHVRALAEARDLIAERTGRAERELRQLAMMMRDASNELQEVVR